MITPKKLPNEIVNMLLPRLTNETEAFYFYRSAANWCKNAGYNFAAAYFENESTDELSHAKGLENYLTLWNVIPNLPAIEKPVLKFDGLVDIIEQAYEMECAVYSAYEDTARKLMASDLSTFGFIQDYVAIQVKAVGEYSDFINQLMLIDSNDKFQVFYWENKAFKG